MVTRAGEEEDVKCWISVEFQFGEEEVLEMGSGDRPQCDCTSPTQLYA
jgi:hypothetical protein